VFTENPLTFLDLLRFAQARTLILAGLRDVNVCSSRPIGRDSANTSICKEDLLDNLVEYPAR